MNRNVYALLTAAILASVLSVAQAETMAERKQRIMRKYMRERQDIAQSDLGVPETPQEEDARVVASEQFKELLSPDFQRQESGVAPLPAVRPMPVQQPERNWWLETAERVENPGANPFSSKTDGEKGSAGSWSPWDRRDDSSAYGGAFGQQRDERDDTYSSSRDRSSIYGGPASQQWDGRRGDTYPSGQSAYDGQRNSGNGSSAWGMSYDGYTSRRAPTSRENDRTSGFYGSQQTDTRGMDGGWGYNSVGGYGSSTSSGLLQSPFASSFDAQNPGSQNQTPAYTPYRSPYEVQGEEQRRYGDSLQPQQPQYSRPNSYQKWKDTNKAWDPTADNSYLNELMQNQRR